MEPGAPCARAVFSERRVGLAVLPSWMQLAGGPSGGAAWTRSAHDGQGSRPRPAGPAPRALPPLPLLPTCVRDARRRKGDGVCAAEKDDPLLGDAAPLRTTPR